MTNERADLQAVDARPDVAGARLIDAAAYAHNGNAVSQAGFYAVACDPRRHVAVEACAGAGKTWMLVSRIVRVLFASHDPQTGGWTVPPHEILAITFTRRAASEMRARLYQWLQQFAAASPERLLAELRSRGVVVPDDPQAAQAMATRLAGLHAALLQCDRPVQIRTFHSWFAALLRAAPIAVLQQLGLPLQYELLEDDAAAKALVWRRFYQALLAQPERREDFACVVRAFGRSQTEKALGAALDKRVEFARADAVHAVEPSVRHFHVLFAALAAWDEPALALSAASAQGRWMGWAQALARESKKTPQTAAAAMAEAIQRLAGLAAVDGAAATACLAALRKSLFVADEDRLHKHLERYPAAQQAGDELQLLCAAQRQHDAWLHQQRMTRLSRLLIACFAELERAHGWIDMGDIERAAMVLLSDPALSGWVQERLDTRVQQLLIDEFQDTNPLQWQALSCWLGSYAGAGGRAPGVFIVGDPKQSIYRFRRAEPQVFAAAQTFVVQALGGDLLSCDHTRRNASGVLDVVNRVMRAAQDEGRYAGFRTHTTDRAAPGQVMRLPPIARMRPSAAQADAAGAADAPAVWRDSLREPRLLAEESLRMAEARQVAAWIAARVAEGLAPGQVMVLSRRRAGLTPVQEALRALRVPAHLGESTALIDCCEVLDIVALLDVLVSPRHDLSLARVLRSPLFDCPDDALAALAVRRRDAGASWFELLQQDWPHEHTLHGVGARLAQWKAWLDALPAHDALQAIFSRHDVLARYAAAAPEVQRQTVLANLRALLAVSLQVAGGRFTTPYALVRALKAGGVLAPATAMEQAVRLLTVHGAKGLEAHTVVLLDTDAPARPAQTMGVLVDWPVREAQPRRFFFVGSESTPPSCALVTRDHELQQREREELNALYVALTRASDTLLLSSIEPHRAAPDSWWQRLFAFAVQVDAPAAFLPCDGPADADADAGADADADAGAGADADADAGAGAGAGAGASRAGFEFRDLPAGPPAQPSAGPAVAPVDDDPLRDLAARIGQAMHRLLEWGRVDERQIAAVRREFALDAPAGARAGAMAQRILDGPGGWAWDTDRLAWQGSEVELVAGDALLRLDRLVQRKSDGVWWVLDYKSSLAPQQDPALVAQLTHYRAAVQAIQPGQVVCAAFLNAAGEWIDLPAARPTS